MAVIGPRHERNAAIIAMARQEPSLTCGALGQKFGLSAASVSLILRGKRGKSTVRTPAQTAGIDVEFVAIEAVMNALEHLDDGARRRVVEYVLARLANGSSDEGAT